MKQTVTDAQRDMASRILTTAMAILRDDQPFDPAHTIFGCVLAARPERGVVGVMEYSFVNRFCRRRKSFYMWYPIRRPPLPTARK
jgi:hypothetical protein